MGKTRTEYRKERRDLLEEILKDLFIINRFNETELERIELQFFKNMKMDLENLIRHISLGQRYIHETHICVNTHDDAPKT